MALAFLGADVEQSVGRLLDAEHRAGEDVAHDREFDQVARVALHVGA